MPELTLPFVGSGATDGDLFSITNTGTGSASGAAGRFTSESAVALVGKSTNAIGVGGVSGTGVGVHGDGGTSGVEGSGKKVGVLVTKELSVRDL
ncbi:hypothetical protein Q8F57_044855 [Paraburkholderia terrae]|uniref:hypothetical protein n=1 Tax=Paraburkholderia terrae TaxID=311230 RepID=UPI00296AC4C8|nr:hypothetical protein [Paraburkholderia terrae]MDW3663788.1 hypothetical protein [Paraburkholderia terrae]